MRLIIIALVAILPLAAHAQDAAAIDVASTNVADNITGPDTVTVRDYVEALMAARDRLIDQRFDDNKVMVDAALASINLRLLGVNEFRQTLADQANNFASKDTVASLAARLADEQARDEGLATRLVTIESSGSPTALQNAKDVQALAARIASIEAQRTTTADNFGWVLTFGGALAGIVGTWVLVRSRNAPAPPRRPPS
jgi:uncharacterized protein YqfB (UPF0267 family)